MDVVGEWVVSEVAEEVSEVAEEVEVAASEVEEEDEHGYLRAGQQPPKVFFISSTSSCLCCYGLYQTEEYLKSSIDFCIAITSV